MDSVLITLAVLGFAAVVLSIYVLSVASSKYMEDDRRLAHPGDAVAGYRARARQDRRRGDAVTFPLMINGELILADRRGRCDPRGTGETISR